MSILKPGPQLDSVTSGWPSSEPIAIILNVIVVHIDIIDFYSDLLRIQNGKQFFECLYRNQM